MKLSLTPELANQLKQVKQKDAQLFKKIQKQLKLFQENHKHPSLRTHKLKGNLTEKWSISIEEDLRILFYVKKGQAIFYLLGTHDEVYRKK